MPIQQPKNILVAPLDWGAGHTTRCIPIVRHLIQLGHNPIVAGNAAQLEIIRAAFPDGIATTPLDGYNVSYSSWNRFLQMGLLTQIPGLLRTIQQEHHWLKEKADQLKLDGVISDNRYGLFHDVLPTVILTHQLRIQTGLGTIADNLVQRRHYKFLNRFGKVWVVDAPDGPGLAGILSHPAILPDNASYTGLLSRLAGTKTESPGGAEEALLVLLSGPEPQRTKLSEILWQQVVRHTGKVVFAEGTITAKSPTHIPPHITYSKRLDDTQLITTLQHAGMVVCRSGYSTIMDLAATGKKAILIPTPGQTEQLYLANTLHSRGVFYSSRQQGFSLQQALSAAADFPFHSSGLQDTFQQYKRLVADWVADL